jgi:tetratricopeptide (TPR) repeat protein
MRKLILLLSVFVWSHVWTTAAAQAHFSWNPSVQDIYSSVTSLKIPLGRNLISTEKKEDPTNLLLGLMESYADLYELFFNENSIAYASIYPSFDKRLDAMKTGPKSSPFYRYSQAVLHLHRAALAIRFDKNVEAAVHFRKSYLLLKENSKVHPGFKPNDFYYGMLTTLIGAVPTNYQWMLNILGMEGSVEEGNRMVLRYLQSQDRFRDVCRNEALLAYPYLVLNFEGNPKKTIQFIETGPYDWKKNHLHAYMATNIYLNNQRSAKAIEVANDTEKSNAYMAMPFWNFEKGYAYLNQLQLEKAMNEFKMFTTSFKGNFYIKDAYEKMSWIAYLQGDQKTANAFRVQVLNIGSKVTDADQSAYENARSGTWPNPILLRARLLSDAGLQPQALKILAGHNSTDFNTAEDKTEFSYRLGRIFDLMGNTEEAIEHYSIAIQTGQGLKTYFAARAALQTALLYEAKNNFRSAIVFYKKCLAMKDHAFKNSLDQKAKAGLQRCQKK